MFNFKIKENSMVDLALIPRPLIIIEVLLWERLEERVVVSDNDAANYAANNTEGEGSGKTCKLETSLG